MQTFQNSHSMAVGRVNRDTPFSLPYSSRGKSNFASSKITLSLPVAGASLPVAGQEKVMARLKINLNHDVKC